MRLFIYMSSMLTHLLVSSFSLRIAFTGDVLTMPNPAFAAPFLAVLGTISLALVLANIYLALADDTP